jgi:cell division septum initiation protein DivIVA
MATWLDRLWRRTTLRKAALRDEAEAATEAEVESIEAALADAEELAQRTNALARDLHKLLARGIARRRAERRNERLLH